MSASFGGYQASAGLGGSLAGGPSGGLHAEASIPGGTGASAGLGGSVGAGGSANAGASVGGESLPTSSASSGSPVGNRVYVPQKPRQRPPDYYDNIFNVSIFQFIYNYLYLLFFLQLLYVYHSVIQLCLAIGVKK